MWQCPPEVHNCAHEPNSVAVAMVSNGKQNGFRTRVREKLDQPDTAFVIKHSRLKILVVEDNNLAPVIVEFLRPLLLSPCNVSPKRAQTKDTALQSTFLCPPPGMPPKGSPDPIVKVKCAPPGPPPDPKNWWKTLKASLNLLFGRGVRESVCV